jgi:integrase
LPIIRAQKLRSVGPLVFHSSSGGMLSRFHHHFRETFDRVLTRAGFVSFERGGKVVPYVTFHSLRHTFASAWVANGGDLYRLQKLLGDHSSAMTQRYAHLAPDAFTGDYARLGGAPASEAEVLPFPASRDQR